MKVFKYLRSLYTSNTAKKMSSEIGTFIFFDLETTGLPYYENNTTKITEMCMIAVQASHIRLGVFPRVQNKLNFCFNPWKLICAESEKITGLSNGLLEHQCKFSAETVDTINSFLNQSTKPICFVAHNGDKFDYPILRREINKTGNSLIGGVLCIDSIKGFRELHNQGMSMEASEVDSCVPFEFTASYDKVLCGLEEESEPGISQKALEAKKLNEVTPEKQIIKSVPPHASSAKKMKVETARQRLTFDVSFKLSDVYMRLVKKSPLNAHQAEADVHMLIMCAATLGDSFVDWANANTKNFCDIPPMVPGKKIGT